MRVLYAFASLTLLAACGSTPQGPAEDPIATPGRGLRHFANSRDNARSPGLADHYVDFSFDYPAGWSMTPQPGDGSAQNYVRVAAPMVAGVEPFAFHVGFAAGTGNAAADRIALRDTAAQLAQQFGASFHDYHIVSQGPDRVGRFDSVGWRFTATAPGRPGEAPVPVYGRGDIILPPGATRGVTLVTLATGRTAEVRNAADLGASGTLKALFDSFRLHTDAGAIQTSPRPAAPVAAAPTRAGSPPRSRPITTPPPRPHVSPAAPPAAPAAAPPAPHPAATSPPAPAERPKQEQVTPPTPPPAPTGNRQ
jgi:hypothetical protein